MSDKEQRYLNAAQIKAMTLEAIRKLSKECSVTLVGIGAATAWKNKLKSK